MLTNVIEVKGVENAVIETIVKESQIALENDLIVNAGIRAAVVALGGTN